jgi:hypothetical protein
MRGVLKWVLSCVFLFTGASANAAGVVRFLAPNEHFYTANSVEMDSVRAMGWVTEPRVFEVSTTQVSGTIPMYRVKLNGYHVFTNNLSLVNLMKSWGGVQEGYLGYIYSSQVAGTVPLYSYANGSTQSRFLTINPNEPPPPGFTADPFGHVAGYVYPPPKYKVGAYYFGMWSPEAWSPSNLVYGNPNFYLNQGNDPWLGVRTIHDALDLSAVNKNDPNWIANQTTYKNWYLSAELKRKPAIGYYDTSQVATLQQHISQATQYGLSYFNFYWYWDSYGGQEELADGLHSFLAANNTHSMKFMLSVCQHGWYFSLIRSQIPQAVNLIVNSYFTKGNYLRTANGSPIIEICDARGIMEDSQHPVPPSALDWSSSGPINTFLNTLRSTTFNATGHYPVILARLDDDATYASQLNTLVEGGTCILSHRTLNYPDAASATKSTLNAIRSRKPFMPCVTQNFDDRPRMGVIKNRDFVTMTHYSLNGFVTSLNQSRYWMDTQTDELSQYLTVYAWNEWHEGGVIEPSERDGVLNLQAINGAFNLVH